MADKKPANASRGYRQAPSSSQRPADEEPKHPHLNVFPSVPPGIKPAQGGPPLIEANLWARTVGADVGLSDPREVERMCKAGHLPAIRMGDLPESLIGVSFSDNTKRAKLLILADPTMVKPYVGPIRAVVYADGGGHPVRVPTNVRTDLYATEEEHQKAAQSAIASAERIIGKDQRSYMVAWVTERDGQDFLRVLQHYDAKGNPLTKPNAKLESSALAFDKTPIYSGEMLRKDTAAAIITKLGNKPLLGAHADDATAGAAAAPKAHAAPLQTTIKPNPQIAQPTVKAPSDAIPAVPTKPATVASPAPTTAPATPPAATAPAPVATPAAATAAPAVTTPPASVTAPSTAGGTSSSEPHPDAEAFAASRAFDRTVAPQRNQAHVLVVFKTDGKLQEAISEGVLRRSAGVASNYIGLLPAGRSSGNLRASPRRGMIEPGAQVVAAVQSGDGMCRLVARMPYAGLDAGASPKNAILLADAAKATAYPPGVVITTGVRNLVPGAIVVSPSGGDAESFAEYTGEIRAKIAKDLADSFGCP